MYFPVFIDLSEKEILVIGAGTIAARRIGTLCGFAGHITVVAPEICGEIRGLAERYPITLREGMFEESLLGSGAESFEPSGTRAAAPPAKTGGAEIPAEAKAAAPPAKPGTAGIPAEARADMVLAATDDPALNRRVASLCRDRGIPVNVCSEKEACDFYFPSVVREGDIVIGINASGKNHGLVKRTRQKLEEFLKK